MTTAALIQSLSNIGVRLELQAGRLRVVGPSSIVTAAMRTDLMERREEILSILATNVAAPTAGPPAPPPPTGAQSTAATAGALEEDGRPVRWLKSDERGCSKCKRCGGPVTWAQVTEDSDPKAKRSAWLRLDPDLMPHGCGGPRSGRFVHIDADTSIQPK